MNPPTLEGTGAARAWGRGLALSWAGTPAAWLGAGRTRVSKVGGWRLAVGFCSTDCSHAVGVSSQTEGRIVRNASLFVLHGAINAPPFIWSDTWHSVDCSRCRQLWAWGITAFGHPSLSFHMDTTLGLIHPPPSHTYIHTHKQNTRD